MKVRKRGFSIIEVVLVIGIAGLIFMMAFIALPSLWASQRDADRRANVMEFITTVKSYQTNNARGALPTIVGGYSMEFDIGDLKPPYAPAPSDVDWKAFAKNYLKDWADPKDDNYKFYITNCRSGVAGAAPSDISVGTTCTYGRFNDVNVDTIPASGVDSTIYVAVGAVCNGDQAVKSSNARDVAAVYVMERAGRYCHSTST